MKVFIIAAFAVLIIAVSAETEGVLGAGLVAMGSKITPGQVYCYNSYSCNGNVIVTDSTFECCRIRQGLSYFDPSVLKCHPCW